MERLKGNHRIHRWSSAASRRILSSPENWLRLFVSLSMMTKSAKRNPNPPLVTHWQRRPPLWWRMCPNQQSVLGDSLVILHRFVFPFIFYLYVSARRHRCSVPHSFLSSSLSQLFVSWVPINKVRSQCLCCVTSGSIFPLSNVWQNECSSNYSSIEWRHKTMSICTMPILSLFIRHRWC